MPWCPKCKNEYRDGIKVCADCGCELTETLETVTIPLIFGDEEQMRSLQKLLEYSKIKGVELKYDETEGTYELFVSEEDWKKAETLKRLFLEQETAVHRSKVYERLQQQAEEAQEDEPAGGTLDITPAYITSADQAMDSRSTAGVFLALGGIGLLASILCLLGVIHIPFLNSGLTLGVTTALFLLFIIIGVFSVKKARVFTQQAKTEDTLRETILQWCREYLTANEIDIQAGTESAADDGVLYFKRTNVLKERINHQFLNLDQGFLDHFIDEQIYDAVFGESEE